MCKGFLKYPRELFDRIIYSDPNAFLVFWELLRRATHEDKIMVDSGKEIVLKRGQAIFGYNELGKSRKLTVQKTRNAMLKLKQANVINVTATSKGSVVTFCNYDNYNGIANSVQHVDNTTSTEQQHVNNTTLTEQQQQEKNVRKKLFNIYDFLPTPQSKNLIDKDKTINEAFELWQKSRNEKFEPLTKNNVEAVILKLLAFKDIAIIKKVLIDAAQGGWKNIQDTRTHHDIKTAQNSESEDEKGANEFYDMED